MRPFIAFIRKQPGSGFGVCFPDLPHCDSTGRTIEEARQNAEYALGLHCRRMRDTGKGIPVPSYMHELPWSAEEIANGLVMLITPQARAT